MKSMTSNELRQQFLNYFNDRDHEIVESSPLVPDNDATLLFTNAGMVQFKDVFLGNEKRSYNRAVTSQRCLRAGGKHSSAVAVTLSTCFAAAIARTPAAVRLAEVSLVCCRRVEVASLTFILS